MNRCKYGMQNEYLHIFITCIIIPEICLTTSLVHAKLNLTTNIEREIDFVVTLGPETEHLTINFVCKLVFW